MSGLHVACAHFLHQSSWKCRHKHSAVAILFVVRGRGVKMEIRGGAAPYGELQQLLM